MSSPPPLRSMRLTARKIYILPTDAGFVFAAILLIMLVGSINYTLNLGFSLTFLSGGIAFVSILHTFRNLWGLGISVGKSQPVFAGETAHFALMLDDGCKERSCGLERSALTLRWAPRRIDLFSRTAWHLAWLANIPDGHPRHAASNPGKGSPPGIDSPGNIGHEKEDTAQQRSKTLSLKAGEMTSLTLPHPSQQRGWMEMPHLEVASLFPLGLFRAWAPFTLAGDVLVYPAPAPVGDLPPPVAVSDRTIEGSGGRDGGDFSTLRAYRPGDPPRRIHWRLLARSDNLITKEFDGEGGERKLILSWHACPENGTEARLSRLCRWVLQADAIEGLRYGLELPGENIAPASGDAHRARCLKALALFGLPDTRERHHG